MTVTSSNNRTSLIIPSSSMPRTRFTAPWAIYGHREFLSGFCQITILKLVKISAVTIFLGNFPKARRRVWAVMQMPSCSSRDSVVWIRYGPEAQGSVRPTDKDMLFRMTFREYLNRGGRCRQQELELIFWKLSGERVILLAGWTRLHGDKSSRSSKEIMPPSLCSGLWDP